MKLVNKCGHPIDILVGRTTVTIPPDGAPARITQDKLEIHQLDIRTSGVTAPLTVIEYDSETTEAVNLPDPEPGVMYIVPRIVVENMADRDDLVFPILNKPRTGAYALAKIA